MKRPRPARRTKHNPENDPLIRLASRLAESTCQAEDGFWEARLTAAVDKVVAENDETAFTAALDHLYGAGGRAYDELADTIEACTEMRHADGGQEVVLIAVPVLAWSRFAIPSGVIRAEALANARVQLQAHVLAEGVRLGLADFLFSPDQLPPSFCETAQLTERLSRAALHDRDLRCDPAQMAETMNFLSDTRYLIGAVAAPRGAPLFRWQEEDGSRPEALKQWRSQGGEILRGLLPACALELLLPMAYYAATREADRASRPYSLRAAVAFLQTTLNVPAADLRAVVAPYYDRHLEEFRIGFTRRQESEVLHGVVWPLLESEDEGSDAPAQIDAVLKEAGLREVMLLDQRFPMEYCDDCGAPLYPNPDGEPVHAEMPDQEAAAPQHLH